ncbi:MAG: hypothetical protein IBX64_13935, partial [Actinobacteria bacterium]|nr:hypothetical protein [Actinomycetota bacterium]
MPLQTHQRSDDPIRLIEVKNLYLDHENPRLTKPGSPVSDAELLKELYRRYDLRDVLLSLAQHGYFSEEPLIAVPRDTGDVSAATTFTVVEGNRRLAALKLLLFQESRNAVGARNLPTVTEEVKSRLDPVPVKVYESRGEIVPYLGVRHITGVKPWDSQAKAKYILALVNEGYGIAEITKMVASRSDVVTRCLLTLYLINQSNEVADTTWQEEAESFNFSFLYTAIGYTSVRKYLGLTQTNMENPQPSPVPEKCRKELIQVMTDLYGSPDTSKPPRLTDSRDIRKLAAVYDSREALEGFRAGATLEQAYRKSGGERAELIELVQDASRKLDD